jgi:hypothetical protein
MNIKGIDNLHSAKLPAGRKVEGNGDFREILGRAVSGTGAPAPIQLPDPRGMVLNQSDKVLDLLDNYAGKLADASTSLKEIHPLVRRIENEVRLMESRAASLAGEHRDMGHLLRQVAATASVAVLKFERGDYI